MLGEMTITWKLDIEIPTLSEHSPVASHIRVGKPCLSLQWKGFGNRVRTPGRTHFGRVSVRTEQVNRHW